MIDYHYDFFTAGRFTKRRATMLNRLTIKTRLFAGFGIVLLLALLLGAVSVVYIRGIGHQVDVVVYDRWPKAQQLDEVTVNINIVARALRNAVIDDDPQTMQKELDRVNEAGNKVTDILGKLENMIKTEKGKMLLSDVKSKRAACKEDQIKVVDLIKQGKKKEAGQFLVTTFRSSQTAYFEAVDAFVKFQGHLMDESGRSASAEVQKAQLVVVVLLVIAILLAIGISLLIMKSITGPLQEGISVANRLAAGDLTATISMKSDDEVGRLMAAMGIMVNSLRELIAKIKYVSDNLASGSNQLSASAEEISRGMDGQANRSNQIATATEEMSQTVVDVAKNASNIADISTETFREAQGGESVVNQSVQEVQAIAATVAESSEVMHRLGSNSKEIGNIVDVIKDIADQTNLLALNAAIEAARAGEQGRGFAVVADEVRKLAERTSQATSQINTMIQAIQKEVEKAAVSMSNSSTRVESGVEYSLKAGDVLGNIVKSVNTLQSMVQQIASSTEEMSSVSETISSDIQSIAEGSKEISAGGGQIAQSSSDLARLATELQTVVSQFKV